MRRILGMIMIDDAIAAKIYAGEGQRTLSIEINPSERDVKFTTPPLNSLIVEYDVPVLY